MKVCQIRRRPAPGHHFSIERYFAAVRGALKGHVEVEDYVCPAASTGVWRRARNVAAMHRLVADVYHVTGDVHYVVHGLPPRRTILTIHDVAFETRLRGLRRWFYRKLWLEGPCGRAGIVTTVSAYTRNRLRENLANLDLEIRVVPTCIPDGFAPQPPANNVRWRVLQVGTKPNKNVERVISALSGLGMTLVVVGRLTEHQRVQCRRANLEVEELGHVADSMLPEVYRSADLVVFVSTYEGFGMPVVEAQASGRPVVTSNVCSLPEVSGEGALFVDPWNVQEIREGILRVKHDEPLRNALVGAGLQNAKRFSPARVAAAYLELYQELASGPAIAS